MPSDYPLPSSDLASLGFAARPIEHLDRLIQLAYRGRPLSRRADRPGAARASWRCSAPMAMRRPSQRRLPAANDTLFLLFSQTKVLT